MTNHGDDCYFFYYSTCSKGDSCPFRHCEAAMGSEVVCSLWQESRCFRKVCKFRHMEIKKNRTVIPCYWENQPSGCQKPHCAFHHERSRFIDGVFVPANIAPAAKMDGEEEPAQQEPAPPAPSPANPQLRGVIKADTQENVPSPTHPPVVINPVDDEDEDEDDQFSEEGDDRSKMSSPRKLIMGPKDDSLNFNVRTLEEIRLRKALKASLKKAEEAGFTVPGQHNNGSTGEKENMCSTRRPALFTAKNRPEEPGRLRIADRLEKRTLNDGTPVEGELPLKRSLAQRLGGKMDSSEEESDQSSQRGARLMRERLSLPAESSGPPSPAAPNQPGPPGGEIRIKTLEEIRQEKAAKSQAQASGDSSSDPVAKKVTNTTETLLAKKQALQKRKAREMTHTVNAQQAKEAPEAPEAALVDKPPAPTQPSGGVRVKTLEEIRREKAARLGVQAQSPPAQDQSSSSGSEDGVAPNKRRLLHVNKTLSPASSDVKAQKPAELPEKSKDDGEAVANGKSSAPAVEKARPDSGSAAVKVKTFEEIMREKQLRRQQQEQEVGQSPQGPATAPAAQKLPVTVTTTITAPSSTSTSTPTPSQPAPVPARQRITVKPKVAPPKPVVAPAITAVRTTEPPATASASPKHLPVRLSKRLTVAAPVPSPAPLPVQQTPVSAAAQPEPAVSLAKKPKIAAAAPAPAPAPTPTPTPLSLPVQQNPVSSTVQPDPPVSLAKRQKIAAAAAAPAPASSTVQQSPVSGTVQQDSPLNLAKKPKTTPSAAPAPAPAPVPLAVQQTPVSGMAQPDTTRETSPLKKSPENKVKPKVNVKPVVKSVKPSAHVRPGQKRKAAAGQSSAVAAVKPLSAASTAADEAPELQEPPCKRSEMSTPGPLQAPAISSSALERNTQLNDEPQTVPVFKQSPTAEANNSLAENLMTVPQSPSVLKTPSQTRARKGSTTTPTPRATLTSAASSTSAVDDFEELINEFEMDDEVDLEPDKGEDDLLLELSEMIGS
ncbi:zinc finger CCCH domain-containing protein 11A [Sardina pilchardus]|uniref:zinc finger CCCH domain-containing protein 11A n=1 Tax=Sardina pilchardus TaxID=27697 RepID=UPI002E11D2CA